MINNPYIIYILHRYFFISFDLIEILSNRNIEHLAMLCCLHSIKDIKDKENWIN
jgi:hypothetical protein